MSKTVKVTYNADTLETTIVVDGKEFDTSRINGKEIADWAYPFMVRKVRWDGFYDEMVTKLGGEKAFDLVFEGSEEALAELKEAWEDAPVNVVSGEHGNTVTIMYDANALTTEITVNGQAFDTTRIKGKEIEDWVYPFMMRKVKWDGIFDELKNVLGTDEYDIQFSGTRAAMKALMEDCPETVTISLQKGAKPAQNKNETPVKPVSSSKTVSKTIEYDSDKVNELWNNEEYNTALAIVSPAAESGNMDAQCDLGLMYQLGWGVDVDMSAALKWYLKAAEQGDVLCMEWSAQIYAGLCEGSESLKNSRKAEEWFKKAEKAATEDDDFNYYCYYVFLQNEGREKDALAVMKRGAKNGNVDAMRDLADAYYWGKYGVSEDFYEAGEWFEKAADAGDAVAMTRVGEFYLYATGNFPQDNDEAFHYLTKAVEMNDNLPYAHTLLGKCYLNGWGTNENTHKANEHLKKAANANSAEAMYWLGILYSDADNESEAVNWYKKAADKGNILALENLGDCYSEGDGVAQNEREAVRLYRKASEHGNVDAKAKLGGCYILGSGVSENFDYGVQLIEEAAEEGSEYAISFIQAYNEGYDEAYDEGYNDTVEEGNSASFINKAKTYLNSDQGKELLKKTATGAAKGAVEGLANGGGWTSVVGGAVTGAAGAAITTTFSDDDE